GLTGNIASGKSAVADVWRTMGAVIVDADELSRRAVEPGTPALAEIRQRFGAGVLQGTGELDRAVLREVVFSDEAKRRDLEKIVHPEVERLRLEAEREAAARGVRIVVHMIPLLFETGLQERFDIVVLVDAPEAERRRRIIENRGIEPAAADAMMQAQMDVAPKREAADFVIDNDADLAVLAERAEQVWNEIEARLE
ncbi:MAG TPA: dephospho-CoA kinase, partial [Longimicrobiales bacterium]|nr:dephospho-CoA kinase [Longimicrobiales bacterium]